MKILLINSYYRHRGGEDIYFDLLKSLLQKKGHTLYCHIKKYPAKKESLKLNIKLAINMYSNRKYDNKLSQKIAMFKPDLAHINNIYPSISPTIYDVCYKLKIPIIQSIHTYRFMCPKGTLFRNEKICQLCVNKNFKYPAVIYSCYHNSSLASLVFSTSFYWHNTIQKLKFVDKFIFPAEIARDYYIKHLPIPSDKCIVIPHFIRNPVINTNRINKKEKYFLFIGRLSPEKRILNLLNVFSTMPKINLIVVGTGPLGESVLKYKDKKNIKIKGYVSEKEKYELIKEALCTIIPSVPWFEFGPYVLIESFAYGIPVIVPKAGVFKKRVKHGINGILYKPDDFNDLKSKILDVVNNKYNLTSMKLSARMAYQNNYTEKIFYKKLISLYQEVMSRN